MSDTLLIVVGVAVVCVLFWLLMAQSTSAQEASPDVDLPPLDSSDPKAIGFLIGMTGGDVVDAVVARQALERFEQLHRRKATTGDVATSVGLMRRSP